MDVVFQSVDALPEGFSVPEGREKPWGTGHAALMAREVIHEPFAVINADDFYGRDAFVTLADFLSKADKERFRFARRVREGCRRLPDFGN